MSPLTTKAPYKPAPGESWGPDRADGSEMVVEPIPRVRPLAGLRTCFETQSRAGSYGFRPGRGLQEMLWGERREKASSSLQTTDGVPHATAE